MGIGMHHLLTSNSILQHKKWNIYSINETCKTYEPLIVFLKITLQSTTTKKLNNNMNQIFIFNFIYLFLIEIIFAKSTRQCIMIKLLLGHVEAGFKACDIYSSFLIHLL